MNRAANLYFLLPLQEALSPTGTAMADVLSLFAFSLR
jgi:hypothetical protein